jgi:hypothetical protein
VKVIRDKKYSEVLGAHIVGPHATELIAEFVVGRHLETTVEEMDRAMHPHPTLSEAVAEAALAALGHRCTSDAEVGDAATPSIGSAVLGLRSPSSVMGTCAK